jgi:hypothetical protein
MKSGNVNPTQISNIVASLLDQGVTDIPPSHKVLEKRKKEGVGLNIPRSYSTRLIVILCT